MKSLTLFNHFDWLAFSKDKKLVVIDTKEWKDYNSHQHLGTKVIVVIAEDNTEYRYHGEIVTGRNEFEKLTIKVPKDITIKRKSQIALINAKASVYGTYNDELSITADDIKILHSQEDK